MFQGVFFTLKLYCNFRYTEAQIENLYVQKDHCRGLLVSDLITYSSCAITSFPCARHSSKSRALYSSYGGLCFHNQQSEEK
jgi:hypothetical protein